MEKEIKEIFGKTFIKIKKTEDNVHIFIDYSVEMEKLMKIKELMDVEGITVDLGNCDNLIIVAKEKEMKKKKEAEVKWDGWVMKEVENKVSKKDQISALECTDWAKLRKLGTSLGIKVKGMKKADVIDEIIKVQK